MTSTSRWIRLDTTWDHSEWVAAMDPEAQLAWVKLLCHVKAHGYAGSVKRLTPAVAARVWGLRVTSVTEMEAAAIEDEALVIEDDEWIITSWSERQSDPTAAERMRRYRERQQEDTPEPPPDDVTRNERNVTGVTPTETETYTETSMVHAPARTLDAFPVKPRQVGGQYQYPEAFERAFFAADPAHGPVGELRLMATRTFTPVLGKRLRVTELTSGGAVVPGPTGMHLVTDGFITVNLTAEVEDGTEILAGVLRPVAHRERGLPTVGGDDLAGSRYYRLGRTGDAQ